LSQARSCLDYSASALRLVVPPVTSQYPNCAKNSLLAVAIGYPDLSIANTTINQTGQAIEASPSSWRSI
jgi:general L-amino acid transport system permease protein